MPASAASSPGDTRRRFLASFTALGLGSTLLPGVLWAQVAAQPAPKVTVEMLRQAMALAGLAFTDAELEGIVQSVTQSLARYEQLHALTIPDDVAPPFYFNPLVPGMSVPTGRVVFRPSKAPKVRRPAQLEDAAFWPVTQLAALLKSRAVTSLELTEMYLARLHRLNTKLNCVVTFLDDLALAQARAADAEIAAGRYRGPLHGIPWGCKDIIAVKGYKTTWGSGAYEDQVIDADATVVAQLRDAGAVLIAKLTTGELAGGDRWFGGRTNNPWKLDEGSSGSSAGPGSATAAGCVGFAIGTETGGSILSPSARCGVTGLRPTFGRVSRLGAMTLSWTQDRLGPMCRSVEDCALVMQAIARPDGRDLSVMDVPFSWDAKLDLQRVRVGYLADALTETKDRDPEWVRHDQATVEQLRRLGLTLVPLRTPEFPTEVLSISVEAAVFFDPLLRSGRVAKLTNKNRGTQFRAARTIPAVEYLQSQRARTMMMQALAAATEGVDVYLAPSTGGNPRPPEPPPGASPPAGGGAQPVRNLTDQHYRMANLACYPALALPNGFASTGAPTSITFMARPFREAELLAVAKAYQDATDWHRKQPVL